MALKYLEVDVDAAAENILADEAPLLGLRQCFFQIFPLFLVLVIHVNERGLGLCRSRGDETAFDQLMRNGFQQVTVLKRAGLMLTGVADKISLLDPMIENLVPLHAGGKACTTTTTQSGRFEFLNHLIGRQFLDALFPGLIAADLDVGVDVPGSPIDLFDEAGFRSVIIWSRPRTRER